MENNWEIKELDKIIDINPTEALKKGAKAKKIGMERLQPYCRDIPSYEISEYSGGTKFRNGDTIMARITPCLENGKIAMINVLKPDEVGFGSTEYIVFRAKENITTPDFVYYLVCSSIVKEPAIKSMVGSSGRQRVQTDVIKKLNIALPPYKEQKKIGQILKGLDDKIKLNNEINSNLYQLATSLYNNALELNSETSTFVSIGDISDVKGGKRLPKGVNLQTIPNKHPYIRVRDLNDTVVLHINNEFEYVDDETQKGISRYIVNTSDVLISIVGTIGLTAIVHSSLDAANLTENCVKITNLKATFPEYILLYLRSKEGQEAIARGTVGAVQAKLPLKNILSINVPLLKQDTMIALQEQIVPLFNRIAGNTSENMKLTTLRDTLLPKLMSGEVDLSNIDI